MSHYSDFEEAREYEWLTKRAKRDGRTPEDQLVWEQQYDKFKQAKKVLDEERYKQELLTFYENYLFKFASHWNKDHPYSMYPIEVKQ